MDGDFFAAPVVRAQAAPAVMAPIAQPPRRTSAGGPWLLWTVVAAVLLAGAASMVAMMGGLAHHDSKALDTRSAAYDATTKSDLAQTAAKEQAYFAEKGQYGGAQEIGASVLPGPTGTQVTVMSNGDSFCLQGAHLGTKNVFYYSSAGGLLPLGQTCS